MTTTPTSKLQAWKDWLFKTGTNAQGEQVYLNEDVQKIWDNFKNEQALNKQTPRVSTATQSLADAQAAGKLDIDLKRGYDKAIIDQAYAENPLKDLSAEREVRTRGGHLDNQADAYIKMRQPTLDIQQQIINNRSNVDLPALIALEDRRMAQQTELNNQIARDQLLGRLVQTGLGLGLLFS